MHLVLTIQFLQIDISLVPLELNVRSQQFSSETGRNGGRGYRGSADGSPKSLFNATAESHSSPYCDRLEGGEPSQENESQHHYSLRRGKVSIYSYLYPNLFNATGKGNDGDGAEIELRSES